MLDCYAKGMQDTHGQSDDTIATSMSANVSLSSKQERAAMLLADDLQTDAEIAAGVGVADRTLWRWKLQPAFQERIAFHRHAQADAIKAEGIANRQNRVAALNDRWYRMQAVIAARAEAYTGDITIPGGETGLLVKQLKSIGFGENNTVVEEYAVDTGLLRELRAHEEQAAKELGQWEDKTRVEGDMLVRQYVGVNPEDV